LSGEDFKPREQDQEILRLLIQGVKDIADGKGHDLDEVLADADKLVRPKPCGPKNTRGKD